MRVDNEQRRERLRSKNEWLEGRLRSVCPSFPDAHRFEYNDVYDFWRASYYGKTRQMIRDYEAIKRIQLGSQYELLIDGRYLYISEPLKGFKNQYETLIANTPMNSPLESSQLWDLQSNNPDIEFASGSFATTLKSHVHSCHEKAAMLKLEEFYRAELGPMGYSVQVYSKGRGRDVDYSIVITHNTETPDACIDHLVGYGFALYDPTKAKAASTAKPAAEIDKEALSAREHELLKELEAVRKKLAQ
jgi:hypothetical protein